MIIFAIITIVIILAFALQGCNKKPIPTPEPPEPNPVEKTWEDYYPKSAKIPATPNYGNWRPRNFNSNDWSNYESVIQGLFRQTGRDVFDDIALSRILMTKLLDGRYLFKWTSDMEIWGQDDHWASPDEFLYCRKDEKGNCDPNGLYRDDCDGFAGLNSDILYRMMEYPLVWWLEIYWQRKSGGVWRGFGHAITVYKREWHSPYRVFCNQSWVASVSGKQTIEDIVQLYVPTKTLPDNYRLLQVKARHPITGKMLWTIV